MIDYGRIGKSLLHCFLFVKMYFILSSQAEVQGILLLMVSITFPVALEQQEKASFWNLLFSHPVEYLRI